MNDTNSLVVVVLAPFEFGEGDEDVLIVSGRLVPVHNIWGHFIGSCCPKLVSKPKIFFYLNARESRVLVLQSVSILL
jgi:hypothetical protein